MDIIQQVLSMGFFGTGVVVSSLLLFTIGLPIQIYKNFKNKNTEEISVSLFILYFFAYVVWLWYGIRVMKLPIIIPNIPATLAGFVILVQLILYRNKKVAYGHN